MTEEKYLLVHRLPFKNEIKIEGEYDTEDEALDAKIPFIVGFQSAEEWIDIAVVRNGEVELTDFMRSEILADAMGIDTNKIFWGLVDMKENKPEVYQECKEFFEKEKTK